MEVTGFESIDNVDPCIFISDKVILMVYVDDMLFFIPEERYAEKSI